METEEHAVTLQRIATLVLRCSLPIIATVGWLSIPLSDLDDPLAYSPGFVFGYTTYWCLLVGTIPCTWLPHLLKTKEESSKLDLTPATVMLIVPAVLAITGSLHVHHIDHVPVVLGVPVFGLCCAIAILKPLYLKHGSIRAALKACTLSELKVLAVLIVPALFWGSFVGLTSLLRMLAEAKHWAQVLVVLLYPFIVLAWRQVFNNAAASASRELTLMAAISFLASVVGTIYSSLTFPHLGSHVVFGFFVFAKTCALSVPGFLLWRRHRNEAAMLHAAIGSARQSESCADSRVDDEFDEEAMVVSSYEQALNAYAAGGVNSPSSIASNARSLDTPASLPTSKYSAFELTFPRTLTEEHEHELTGLSKRTLSARLANHTMSLSQDARAVSLFATQVLAEWFALVSVLVVATVLRYGNNASLYPSFQHMTTEQYHILLLYVGITWVVELPLVLQWSRFFDRNTHITPFQVLLDLAESRGWLLMQNMAFAYVFPMVVLTPHNYVAL